MRQGRSGGTRAAPRASHKETRDEADHRAHHPREPAERSRGGAHRDTDRRAAREGQRRRHAMREAVPEPAVQRALQQPDDLMSSLAAALAYENEDVIGAFHDKYGVSLDDSRAFFTEVKKWLWLCAQARCAARPLPVFDSMTWLDEMWHTFILFTLDYSRYCEEHFGFYIHHAPTGQAEQARHRARLESEPEALR